MLLIKIRSLHAIIQKRPFLLDKEYKFFFVKYNDPIYVKLEKIDILYKLNEAKNFEHIMGELRNYAITEFDNELVKKSIAYIGNIGFKFEKAADLCVDSINEIMEYNQDFTVNHAVIVARDLLRKYKDKTKTRELLRKINQDLLVYITEADAKSAFLYILGEFCTEIDTSTAILATFIESFTLETFVSVKLQILTAAIKNYVNKPDESEELITSLLQKGGEESENPDVRDRAYLYWRLLENEPDIARNMISGERPSFEFKEDILFDGELCTNIVENMTNISAVYHKSSETMIPKDDMVYDETVKIAPTSPAKSPTKSSKTPDKSPIANSKSIKEPEKQIDLLSMEDILGGVGTNAGVSSSTNKQNNNTGGFNMEDIFGFGSTNTNNNNNNDEFEFNNKPTNTFVDESNNIQIFDNYGVSVATPTLCLRPNQPGQNGNTGLALYTTFARENGAIYLGIYARSFVDVPIRNLEISLNKNSFGISPVNSTIQASIPPNGTQVIKVALEINNDRSDKQSPECPFNIPICIRSSLDTFVFSSPFLVNVLFTELGKMTNQGFVEYFKGNQANPSNVSYVNSKMVTEEAIARIFEKNNIYQVAKNNKANPPLTYYSLSVSNVISCIIQVSFNNGVNFKIISNVSLIVPLIKEVLDEIVN